jgi:hypothetical protein
LSALFVTPALISAVTMLVLPDMGPAQARFRELAAHPEGGPMTDERLDEKRALSC